MHILPCFGCTLKNPTCSKLSGAPCHVASHTVCCSGTSRFNNKDLSYPAHFLMLSHCLILCHSGLSSSFLGTHSVHSSKPPVICSVHYMTYQTALLPFNLKNYQPPTLLSNPSCHLAISQCCACYFFTTAYCAVLSFLQNLFFMLLVLALQYNIGRLHWLLLYHLSVLVSCRL